MSIVSNADAGDGAARRDAALDLIRRTRAELVCTLGRAAVLHLLRHGTVSADDVRQLVPIPDGISPKVTGVIFADLVADGVLRRVGDRKSTRRVAHARRISVWACADPVAATAWLAEHPPLPPTDLPTA